ncbi:CaiB/BaiF CoA transferase family protein [Pseudoponticoccus marisrubri]|uniref:Acyl-CoA transferase n=1 Tax=Pseudoponticoccus marisrubri TaxID=1685382 RepID=A0A0W7WHE2_9RHOB|nr:CaiB/BaiF CoA-transferase family protein [Pseudoponticoccus marisrubri]KUF09902.1 acyl-CoA transferase [Pseudoponticoccus marisrubri]
MTEAPLDGVVVLDLSQFLSGPYATLRLSDLGARVIKVERPDGGDLARRLYLSDTEIGGDSTLFHAINRSKESLALNFKDAGDIATLKRLVAQADVVVQNFRPGVATRLGIDCASLQAVNPGLVYATISGYGPDGPWMGRPGQDLLAQARSGVTWLNGDDGQGPVPFGLAIADMLAGAAAAQGILAALVRKGITGQGAHVETSLLEALLDYQFEVLTTYLNDGHRPPKRAATRSANAYVPAPYGVYDTADGYLALAMTPIPRLRDLLDLPALERFADPATWFEERDAIKAILAETFATRPTAHWLSLLEPADIWCAEVLDWPAMLASEGFVSRDMLQTVTRADGVALRTTRTPLVIDGQRAQDGRAAPRIGADTARIREEFGL